MNKSKYELAGAIFSPAGHRAQKSDPQNTKTHARTLSVRHGFHRCRGRSRTSTGTLAAAQDCRGRYPQPTGGQPQSVRTSADRRYAVFIRESPPPRQEGMSAKISSPHSVEELASFDKAILGQSPDTLQIFQE
jgi:hypothetical protein